MQETFATHAVRLRSENGPPFVADEMPSLPALLAAHAPLLVLDAASTRVQVGVIENDGAARWASIEDEAGVAVFRGVGKLGVELSNIKGFVFCDGPGSILGIRSVAMALRTWNVLMPRPVFAYHSLVAVAQALGKKDLTLIADARRETWHAYSLGGELKRVSTAELSGPLATPAHFRAWSTPPAGVETVAYDLAEIFARLGDAEIFRATEAPDAFLHEEPSYVTWTPQIHRAPMS